MNVMLFRYFQIRNKYFLRRFRANWFNGRDLFVMKIDRNIPN